LSRGLRRIGNVSLRVSRPHPISGLELDSPLGTTLRESDEGKAGDEADRDAEAELHRWKASPIRPVRACPRGRAARRGGLLRHGPEPNWPALPPAGSHAGCAQNSGCSFEGLAAAVAVRDDPPGREQAHPLDPPVVPPAAARAITPRRGRLRACRHGVECSGRSLGGDRQASPDRRARTDLYSARFRLRSKSSVPRRQPCLEAPALPCNLSASAAARGLCGSGCMSRGRAQGRCPLALMGAGIGVGPRLEERADGALHPCRSSVTGRGACVSLRSRGPRGHPPSGA
jgi:hypothetical protein